MTISISNAHLTATFKAKGAELTALTSKQQNYIWEGNPTFWGKHSPILFPIVGTLKDNTYCIDNKKYNLNRHGFARDLDFDIVAHQKESITFSLKSSQNTHLVFPFEFELQIKYELHGSKLNVFYQVQNKDKKIMPFSIGGHPAFALPRIFEDYSLQLSGDDTLIYYLLESDLIAEESKILTLKNNKLNLNYKQFENDALVFKSMQSDSITILENDQPFVKMNFKGFPNFGIWTKPNAAFICLEPWYGYSDTTKSTQIITEKEGIQLLHPDAFFNALYSIEIF